MYLPRELAEAPTLRHDAFPTTRQHRLALLLNPFYPKDPRSSFGKHVLTPTLALTSVAASTPENWSVHYWDENLLQGPPPLDPFPEVVGITVHLTFAERAYELARWYRRRGAKVVLGGLHVVSCPDEAAPHADALALGEGVQLWPQILRDVERGHLRKRYHGSFRTVPYREAPVPKRDIVDNASFLTTASLIATRGCSNRCGFCYLATTGIKMPCQMRDPEDVARELADLDEPYGVFTDNNLGARQHYLRELCRALAPVKKVWSAAVTIDVTDDPDLVREMALAGCTGVFVGFETLDGQNLDDAGKKTPAPEDYARRVEMFHRHGIQVNGSFVLGFDHDDATVFERTVRWIEENRLECATFHIMTPYPGTPLFRQMKAEGRLLHEDWARYDTSHVVFQPARMSPEELQAGYEWCYQRLFSHRSIWMRRPQSLPAVPPYLAMAYLYKRANWMWPFLIKHRLTRRVWRPLVELTRRRHVRYRARLAARPPTMADLMPPVPLRVVEPSHGPSEDIEVERKRASM